MKIPGFNADASLYKMSQRYQTSRNMINLSTQMIYPAMDDEGEVIRVTGCQPGLLQFGQGDNMVCVDPNPPGGAGPSGGSTGGGGGGGGGAGGGGTGTQARPHGPRGPHPRPPRKFTMADATSCTYQQLNTDFGSACVDQLEQDVLYNSQLLHEAICDPATGTISCCTVDSKTDNIIRCIPGPFSG